MNLILRRKYLNDKYTIGHLYIDGEYFSDTIEDRDRDLNMDGDLYDLGEGKVFKETAIPYGKYPVILSVSPKFKRALPLVQRVRHFIGIRFHKMNTAKDSWGCIGIGENKILGGIIKSEIYEMKLVQLMIEAICRGEKISLKITRY